MHVRSKQKNDGTVDRGRKRESSKTGRKGNMKRKREDAKAEACVSFTI